MVAMAPGYQQGSDISDVTWGLPELTRAFLVAEKLVPRGTLYTNHTNPPGLEGLYTVKSITEKTGLTTGFQVDVNEGGWDRYVISEFTPVHATMNFMPT
jgi:hypothetical protein